VTDVKDRHTFGSERCQQIRNSRQGIRVVAASAGVLPFVKTSLHINNDERDRGGCGWAHASNII
jgi:hypothetical protein